MVRHSNLQELAMHNQRLVDTMTELIEAAKSLKFAFTTFAGPDGRPLQFEQYADPRMISDLVRQTREVKRMAEEAASARTKIPQRCHHLIKAIPATESSTMTASTMLLQARLDLMNEFGSYIGKKQASKFIRGREVNPMDVFQPGSRDMALFMGWYGVQCPFCQSWRLERSAEGGTAPSVLRCIDCEADVQLPGAQVGTPQCRRCGITLWTEIVQKLKKKKAGDGVYSTKCPGCAEPLLFPASLF